MKGIVHFPLERNVVYMFWLWCHEVSVSPRPKQRPWRVHVNTAHDAITTGEDVKQDGLRDFRWDRNPRGRHHRQVPLMVGARMTHVDSTVLCPSWAAMFAPSMQTYSAYGQ